MRSNVEGEKTNMKVVAILIVLASSLYSHALIFNAKRDKTNALIENNSSISTARSNSTQLSRSYTITIKKGDKDKDEYVLFGITYVFVSYASGGSSSKKFYSWIPESFKKIELDNEKQNFVFEYSTPTMKFNKEKWTYIGDYSSGTKLNGVFIALATKKDGKIKYVLKDCQAKAIKTLSDAEKIGNGEKLQELIDRTRTVEMESCFLKEKEE